MSNSRRKYNMRRGRKQGAFTLPFDMLVTIFYKRHCQVFGLAVFAGHQVSTLDEIQET
jgi:hypothetical protein